MSTHHLDEHRRQAIEVRQDPVPGSPRVGVLVVAYNAAGTLVQTLARMPARFARKVDHVLVCDDASSDETYEVGLRFQSGSTLPLTIVRHEQNLGYGGNQKHGYGWAIEQELDVVVLLHGDGQYAPEHIEDLVAPLAAGDADAVFGSRMMVPGGARAGGMPLYKYVGNRILTGVQNRLVGLDLTEWHSGYRAYRVDALVDLDLASYSDGFDFDTEIILGLHAQGKRIAEVPIPTYYGDEICYVNGMKYAKDVTLDVLKYRLRGLGFGTPIEAGRDERAYELKPSEHSSHGVMLDWLGQVPPTGVLDVGCSDGQFAALIGRLGHRVTGVDLVKHMGVSERMDRFVEADLNQGLPAEVGRDYRTIVAGDVLEHVIDPQSLLADLADRLVEDGEVIVSVPNFAHWYPRTRVAIGRFDYDQRGLLDNGHVRFFTRASFERLVRRSGMRIVERRVVGSPVDVLDRTGQDNLLVRVVRRVAAIDRLATRVWPTMFGYQFLYRLERA
ncbi:bifunctional glycosyltransferase/class I SAM-dependent methyltransferase [Nocardioides sp. YIM 152315]|uniref:bifunctional glycosyltransferase/class I SAM-dependent methyltransferase n=1 Tax=Nocardioides sp. YIM 152315 TaxID=3031760 RepID=UPI0023DA1083|nr:bifunctional glycosyltransferase/class I SAM-dependent methyltransferase [Nocardioides sp. YIM 152315]MDF1603138.1 bifunctional glycosyltransferase/class I SAM-dependent methyltransferase [Nocardioides sp. YIM 152315]